MIAGGRIVWIGRFQISGFYKRCDVAFLIGLLIGDAEPVHYLLCGTRHRAKVDYVFLLLSYFWTGDLITSLLLDLITLYLNLITFFLDLITFEDNLITSRDGNDEFFEYDSIVKF